jgi:hypothetical protein
MVMDAIIINHCYSSEGSCVDEQPNVDAAKFFELLIFFLINYYGKLSVIACV